MLQLKNIKKDYFVAGKAVPALNGITLNFKQNEFVSILGVSGSGKTTLLNIIGGLDRYSSGDLLVNGKSTKNFTDSDWDAYRNTTIGFVFQTYNLISHLSVLDNVEMALRLSGIGAKERKERAVKVLTEVGLAEHINKKPNQLSGGQMQRVAIARALVNNPEVLLADEPTGALDSKTSHQIMELIREISRDRLVIMVTHNAEIANEYSDRIVRLVDGLVVEDSMPVSVNQEEENKKLINKHTSMSYGTALRTSFKNLLTKKGRTIITALAGSIGIIGIALVLSISSGMTKYVSNMQSDTLAGFPLTISQTVSTTVFGRGMGSRATNTYPSGDVIYAYDSSTNTTTHTNILSQDFLNYLNAMDPSLYNSISYTRAVGMNVLAKTAAGGYQLVPVNMGGGILSFGNSAFSEMPNSPTFIQSQYDLLAGTYPTEASQLVLVVDSQNRVNVKTLQALGINVTDTYTFNDFLGKTFKVVPNDLYYTETNGTFVPGTDYDTMYNSSGAITVSIVGILRVSPNASSAILSNGINYTTMLTDEVLKQDSTSQIVKAQLDSPAVDVLTGQPFNTAVTYQSVMQQIGGDATPTGIQIYPVSFQAKDAIKTYLDHYNAGKTSDNQVIYTDIAETLSTALSKFINIIAIVLSAFAAISLVVSSIMIGIITYVSVIERTKEIGIMRSLGARKKDISRIFNAETVLVGFAAGSLGVVIAILLNIPLNLIINHFVKVQGLAYLPVLKALLLILLSTALTLIAGLIPSQIAAKKDPVIALRTDQ